MSHKKTKSYTLESIREEIRLKESELGVLRKLEAIQDTIDKMSSTYCFGGPRDDLHVEVIVRTDRDIMGSYSCGHDNSYTAKAQFKGTSSTRMVEATINILEQLKQETSNNEIR